MLRNKTALESGKAENALRSSGKRLRRTNIRQDSRILDIGSGPGALTIPFAQRVAHITAVEPADGMIGILQEKIAEYGVENVSVVQKRWEDVDIESDLQLPCDVVIASFSLSMLDIREAILKMQTVSSRHINIYWFAGETSWDIRNRELLSKLHDKEYQIAPKSDLLFCVLYQLGIYPDITTFSLKHKLRFSSFDEALNYLAATISSYNRSARIYLKRLSRQESHKRGWILVLEK